MVQIIAFILNLFAPIVNTLGAIGLCACIVYSEVYPLVLYSCSLAILGIVFGLYAYRLDIPPRWTWAKSRNELFKYSITSVLGYALNFAMWPSAIYCIQIFIENI